MKALSLLALLIAARGCGTFETPSNYRTTCLVCGQSLDKGSNPITFTYENQEIKVCSPEHQTLFYRESQKYLKKFHEAKIL